MAGDSHVGEEEYSWWIHKKKVLESPLKNNRKPGRKLSPYGRESVRR